ncbi:MAG: polyphosphate polymerase domain-containing protein [bacterium]
MDFKRYELKYYISDIESDTLATKLTHLMQTDPNAVDDKGYRVRSLYYDSLNDECLYEKQSGLLHRRKYRLRTYGTDNQVFRFEIKHKHGQFIHKESEMVSVADARELCAGRYSTLLNYESPMLDRVYADFTTRQYTPKVIVDYQRIAFALPAFNVRITLDTNLRSQINHTNLFTRTDASIPIILEGKQVLEVKYDKFMPDYLSNILSAISGERMAISKYTLARRYQKQSQWEDN